MDTDNDEELSPEEEALLEEIGEDPEAYLMKQLAQEAGLVAADILVGRAMVQRGVPVELVCDIQLSAGSLNVQLVFLDEDGNRIEAPDEEDPVLEGFREGYDGGDD